MIHVINYDCSRNSSTWVKRLQLEQDIRLYYILNILVIITEKTSHRIAVMSQNTTGLVSELRSEWSLLIKVILIAVCTDDGSQQDCISGLPMLLTIFCHSLTCSFVALPSQRFDNNGMYSKESIEHEEKVTGIVQSLELYSLHLINLMMMICSEQSMAMMSCIDITDWPEGLLWCRHKLYHILRNWTMQLNMSLIPTRTKSRVSWIDQNKIGKNSTHRLSTLLSLHEYILTDLSWQVLLLLHKWRLYLLHLAVKDYSGWPRGVLQDVITV